MSGALLDSCDSAAAVARHRGDDLALGLALRDPEFEGRVRRGELTARILVMMGGKVDSSKVEESDHHDERGAAIGPAVTKVEDVEQTL